MIIPTKFDELDSNAMVLGASILEHVRVGGANLEEVFQRLKSKHQVTLDRYLDTLLFLWLCRLVEIDRHHVKLKQVEE